MLTYFALSGTIIVAESVAIVVVESVTITAVSVMVAAVESTAVSSVAGLLWQAAKVSMVPTNRRVVTFFIVFFCGGYFFTGVKMTLFRDNLTEYALAVQNKGVAPEKYHLKLIFIPFGRSYPVIHTSTTESKEFMTEVVGHKTNAHTYYVRTFLLPELVQTGKERDGYVVQCQLGYTHLYSQSHEGNDKKLNHFTPRIPSTTRRKCKPLGGRETDNCSGQVTQQNAGTEGKELPVAYLRKEINRRAQQCRQKERVKAFRNFNFGLLNAAHVHGLTGRNRFC